MSTDDVRLNAATDEHELVERVRHGDHAAFATLFAAHASSLYSYANRFTRSRPAAQDIVHDVFVRVWERRASWIVEQSVGAYLHGAVRRRALNHLRRQSLESRWHERVEESASPHEGGVAAFGASPHALVEARDLAAAIARAVEQLPAVRREVLVLHRQHRLTCGEIATLLGLKPKVVENHVARALKALRALLAAYLTVLVGSSLSGR